jgi:hypothetical protein
LDEAILQSYFDGELPGRQLESVTSHLAACETCAVTARGIEAETNLLAAAFAPEFESAVPTEQLRRRIDAAIAGLQTQRAVVNESSKFSIRALLQSLFVPFSFTPQRAFGYAGLVLVLGFAAILGIKQWGNVPLNQTEVASAPVVTPITKENAEGAASPAPVNPGVVASAPQPSTSSLKNPNRRPRYSNSGSASSGIVAENATKPNDTVKLLPGERSYLQTIAQLDSTINSSNRPMRPALQAEYQRNLALVDRALAATRDAAKKNPNDPDAAEFMMAAYQNKVNLLNAVAEARTFNRQQD